MSQRCSKCWIIVSQLMHTQIHHTDFYYNSAEVFILSVHRCGFTVVFTAVDDKTIILI